MTTVLQRESRSERELLQLGSWWASMTSGAAPLGMLVGAALVPAFGAGASLAATGGAMIGLCMAIVAADALRKLRGAAR